MVQAALYKVTGPKSSPAWAGSAGMQVETVVSGLQGSGLL